MRTLIMLITLAILPAIGYSQTTWYVPDDFPAGIQAAISDASVVNGDTVIVRPGTYWENIDFIKKTITLQSELGPDVTIIDGNQAGSVVTCTSGEGPSTVLDGFTLTNGSATNGGGMMNWYSSPTVTSCTFTGNSATKDGGGMYNYSGCTVTNCTFTGNSAGDGGGMFNYQGYPTVTNCTFSGNSATQPNPYADHSGGGMCNYQGYPTVTNCTFSGNSGVYGGGMSNWDSYPTVANCTFTGNSAGYIGGGMYNESSNFHHPTVTNCTFTINFGANDGGGMYNKSCNPTVTNCTFSGNSCTLIGGGMYNEFSSPTVTNCTFTGNSCFAGGGGMYNGYSSNSTVTNCILWNDTPDEIWNQSSSPTVTYSCVQGGYTGTGNIDQDPLFLDPFNDDYHLTYTSPCIDAGDNNAPSLPSMDFEGDPRIFPGNGKGVYLVGSPPQTAIVDMGADEYCLLKRQGFK